MSDYIVTLDDSYEFDIRSESGLRDYNLGVNYEIPSKSTQYSNLKLDNISSQFNGTNKTFNLTINGDPYYPLNDQQLIISVGDVIQNPGIDYVISGNQIIFTNAPAGATEFFGTALATTADLTRTINILIDNGSFDITPGTKGYLNIDVTGVIESFVVVSPYPGNIRVDVRKTKYSDFPSGFTSIVGTEYPQLVDEDKNKNETLNTWDKVITAGDILEFYVLSASSISKCSIFLRLKL